MRKAEIRTKKLAAALAQFVIITIAVLGMFIAIFIGERVQKALSDAQHEHASSQIFSLGHQITHQLRNHQQVLRDHSKFPIIVQTLMQPELNQAEIKDFMSQLSFLGNQYQEVLLDFKGNIVNSSQTFPAFIYKQSPWVKDIIEGRISSHSEISEINGKFYWRIAEGIQYNTYTEGILLVEIPLNNFISELKISKYLSHITMEILWGEKTALSTGSNITEKYIDLIEPLSQATLRFNIDHTLTKSTHNTLLIETTVLILIAALLTSIFAITISERLFIAPLKHLQELSHALAKEEPILPIQSHSITEFRQLERDFHNMAKIVLLREEELRDNSQELEQLNNHLISSQTQLVQSEKMASLGTLAAGVAHEINNPISFIQSNIEALNDYYLQLTPIIQVLRDKHAVNNSTLKANNISNEDLTYILQDTPHLISDSLEGTERITEIVLGLKNFARVGGNETEKFNINDCIDTTIKIIWNELRYSCEVNKELCEKPFIHGNPGQINQVIMNLLINASHAIRENGIIKIKTFIEDNNVYLSVADNGSGIDDEHLDKLFTPFFTTKEVGKGTGLGLSISHGIIEKHNGRIKVESEIGKGTCFTLCFPKA